MECVSGRICPKGFTCTYSRSMRNYFCCTNINQSKDDGKNAVTESKNVCAIGEPLVYPREPLVYPSTGQAIQCSRSRRCPPGFACKRNPKSELFHCCTVPKSLDMEQYLSRVRALAKTKEQIQQHVNFYSPGRRVGKRPYCPGKLVLLEIETEQKLIRRCQVACPSTMIAINGICKVLPRTTLRPKM
ncbi:hypothetical protein GCK32_017329 [Trichostrongylus colubriformis]|uniref:Uncharacterized protein n=1 Tax=Trichostrongylus colubriformis TaxID=6319 RepID=A0AAN8GCD0_TRICO